MASKVYVCHKWPELNLGLFRFEGGRYVTESEKEQESIEKHEQFGRAIFLVEQTKLSPEEAPVVPPVPEGASEDEPPVKRGQVHQGSRGTGSAHPLKKK